MRASAVKGLSPANYLKPFYSDARRFAGLSPATVDLYLAHGGSAELSAGGMLVLTAGDLSQHIANVAPHHRRHMAKWVNKFNSRSTS